MSTSKIMIKNGTITGHNGRYFESLSEDGKLFKGNGWTVTLTDGRIICHAERQYASGVAVCHREFPLADGTVGLAGGNITSRYAYFRSEEFQRWLDELGLTAVVHRDPNGQYCGFSSWSARGEARVGLVSDGNVAHEDDFDDSRAIGNHQYSVSAATWVVVDTHDWYGDSRTDSRILYTLGDPRKIEGLREAIVKAEVERSRDFGIRSEARKVLASANESLRLRLEAALEPFQGEKGNRPSEEAIEVVSSITSSEWGELFLPAEELSWGWYDHPQDIRMFYRVKVEHNRITVQYLCTRDGKPPLWVAPDSVRFGGFCVWCGYAETGKTLWEGIAKV